MPPGVSARWNEPGLADASTHGALRVSELNAALGQWREKIS